MKLQLGLIKSQWLIQRVCVGVMFENVDTSKKEVEIIKENADTSKRGGDHEIKV